MTQIEIQLGKNGITPNFIQTLKSYFENHETVKVCILPSAGHEHERIKEYANLLLEKLGDRYTYKTIGFKIIIKRWRISKVKKFDSKK